VSSRLLVSVPDATLRAALGDLPPQVDVVVWDLTGAPPAPSIDIVVVPYMRAAQVMASLRDVSTRLIQSQSIGYDGVATILPPGRVVANAATVHEASTAELTMALILAAQRGIPDFVRAAEKGHWAPAFHESLADRTVLLVGYGGVARAVEARLEPFEVTIVRVAHTARDDECGPIHAVSSLPTLLPEADIVVVAVPLTDETTHLVDGAFLSHMHDASLLVNVARGRVADTDALVREARSGRLRLALDVVDPEPLPADHPLFTLDNVLISPHVGGVTSAMLPRMARLLERQIERMLEGEPPLNVVLRS
jgi:phosphoglycerate dehydrogenase-like enzyme